VIGRNWLPYTLPGSQIPEDITVLAADIAMFIKISYMSTAVLSAWAEQSQCWAEV
jgi:hypothetical protein